MKALGDMMGAYKCDISQDAPLFTYRAKGKLCVLTYHKFLSALKSVLRACGIDDNSISGHSFRRGGASYSYTCGVRQFCIKTKGDWASSAFERYLTVPLEHRWQLVKTMATNIKIKNS